MIRRVSHSVAHKGRARRMVSKGESGCSELPVMSFLKSLGHYDVKSDYDHLSLPM